MNLDDLDRAMLAEMLQRPRAGLREYARTLGVARGTVQARFDRLRKARVLASFAPRLSFAELGYPVLAFVHLHLAQGRLDAVVTHLESIPHVIEAHTITGEGDLLCRVVARDNTHLEQVIQTVLETPGVVRTRSEVALTERITARALPLLRTTTT